MGCDINIIVEIRKNDIWSYVEELPKSFDDRNYGVFSILNRNIRNYYNIDGFEPKGLPKDLSIKQCRFISYMESLKNTYDNGSERVCIAKNGEIIKLFDERLLKEISNAEHEKISEEIKSGESKRYNFSIASASSREHIYIQDAGIVDGEFVELPYKEIYLTIREFNEQYYHYTEHDGDYGFFDVNFNSNDLFGHSFLTLAELKSKDKIPDRDKCYEIDKGFYDLLISELEELPESFVVMGENKNSVNIVWSPEPEKAMAYSVYSEGITELENIKSKYKIKSDDDIRIVFAFDC